MLWVAQLHNRLLQMGIPIVGVSEGPPERIDYDPSATPGQIAAGNALLAAWDKRKRRARDKAAIAADVAALPTPQREAALNEMLVRFIQANPDATVIPGDEPI